MKKLCLCLFITTPFIFIFQGCGGVPKDALRMNEATLENRQLVLIPIW